MTTSPDARRRRRRFALTAALVALAAGGAAVGQDRPESILPPGFGDPAPAPTPRRTPAPGPAPAPRATPAPRAAPVPLPSPVPGATPSPAVPAPGATPTPTPTPAAPVDLSAYELPDYARRSTAAIGTVAAADVGLGERAWGVRGGMVASVLMRRLDAPVPSRWLSIALRRALVARTATPAGIGGADFAADRAWLLLRMGEADAARAVVQSVDVADYSPRLFQVAMQAMLANADPAGLCPLVEPAAAVSGEAAWPFARAFCAALSGGGAAARPLMLAARRRTGRTIDALLAEKVAGAAGRGAVTIEWDAVDRLTAWRYGLATATGVAIPERLLEGVRPWVAGWRATEPMLDIATRATAAPWAAGQGVLSHAALADLYAELEAGDAGGPAAALARDLRTASTDADAGARVRALRAIWGDTDATREGYARLVLTARAAAMLPPGAGGAEDAPRIIASMLTAGYDTRAADWAGLLDDVPDAAAMLSLASPSGRSWTASGVEAYASANPARARMLLAGLAALGRIAADEVPGAAAALDVRLGAETSWTRAIAAAGARGEGATVLLLFAVGMQTPDWRGVPAETIYHGCAALRAAGLEGEARMIAAEAIARL